MASEEWVKSCRGVGEVGVGGNILWGRADCDRRLFYKSTYGVANCEMEF